MKPKLPLSILLTHLLSTSFSLALDAPGFTQSGKLFLSNSQTNWVGAMSGQAIVGSELSCITGSPADNTISKFTEYSSSSGQYATWIGTSTSEFRGLGNTGTITYRHVINGIRQPDGSYNLSGRIEIIDATGKFWGLRALIQITSGSSTTTPGNLRSFKTNTTLLKSEWVS